MAKGERIDVISVPSGECEKTKCETCPHVQVLQMDDGWKLVCANAKCHIFKAIMKRAK